MFEGLRVAVVMPAFNEEKLVANAIARVPAFVDQIVLVDDGSHDATTDVAARTRDARLTIVKQADNRGVGAAIARGYQEAFAQAADVAVVMAGDAQMAPEDMPALLAPIARSEADYAKGNRLAFARAHREMPALRWLGNHALSWLTRLFLGADVQDSQCGYTALSRRGYERLSLQDLWPRYGYPNDLIAKIGDANLRHRDVCVRPVYAGEASGIGWKHALVVIPYVLLRARMRRVKHRGVLVTRTAQRNIA